jgi:hypothetical protein
MHDELVDGEPVFAGFPFILLQFKMIVSSEGASF